VRDSDSRLPTPGPMTYTVDGKQYIGVAEGATILAFALR
jgi:hypothetical protein